MDNIKIILKIVDELNQVSETEIIVHAFIFTILLNNIDRR
jgi:hypothetical protein